jgi:nicotinate-nucleotide pyrophosphorylase (carboxylating)
MQMNAVEVNRIIKTALTEDIGNGDVTSNATIPEDAETTFVIRVREPMIACGLQVAELVFKTVDANIVITIEAKEGAVVEQGALLLSGKGNARSILAAERVALNLLRQMCGVATLTNRFVKEVEGTNAVILDTRKTIPGLREIQKYAVTIGGGKNHRFRLDDAVLIKDNHISVSGGITQAVAQAKKYAPDMKVEVECDTLSQVDEAAEAGADIIMLDNMSCEMMREAVQKIKGRIPLEASGNVNLQTVRAIAETGVDSISSGMLTNAPQPVDIGLDIDL